MPGLDEVDVHLVDLGAQGVDLPRHEALLGPAEQRRAAGFRFAADRSRYVCMHGVLRRVLSGYLKTGAESIAFQEHACGKPRVAGGLEFNISASGGRGLIAVARVPVGVDLEQVDGEKVTPELIAEVFNASERESCFRGASPDRVQDFFRGWVRKESVVKALGMGLALPLRLVESRLDLESYASVHDGVACWTCDLKGCGSGYKAALTVAGAGRRPAVRLLSLKA